MADPETQRCAACGSGAELHEHHLVARAVGGHAAPTVMLCAGCHGLVHDTRFPTNHAELTRWGLARAKAAGKRLGGARANNGSLKAQLAGHAAQSERARQFVDDIAPKIEEAKAAGCATLRAIAAYLTAAGVPTPRGAKQWGPQQVRRALA